MAFPQIGEVSYNACNIFIVDAFFQDSQQLVEKLQEALLVQRKQLEQAQSDYLVLKKRVNTFCLTHFMASMWNLKYSRGVNGLGLAGFCRNAFPSSLEWAEA
jgi:hypothetical protein